MSQDKRIPQLPATDSTTPQQALSLPVYNDATGLTEKYPATALGNAPTNLVRGGFKIVRYQYAYLYGVPDDASTLDRLTQASLAIGTQATVLNPALNPTQVTKPPKQYVLVAALEDEPGAVRAFEDADPATVALTWGKWVDAESAALDSLPFFDPDTVEYKPTSAVKYVTNGETLAYESTRRIRQEDYPDNKIPAPGIGLGVELWKQIFPGSGGGGTNLPPDILAALTGADTPSAENVFLTQKALDTYSEYNQAFVDNGVQIQLGARRLYSLDYNSPEFTDALGTVFTKAQVDSGAIIVKLLDNPYDSEISDRIILAANAIYPNVPTEYKLLNNEGNPFYYEDFFIGDEPNRVYCIQDGALEFLTRVYPDVYNYSKYKFKSKYSLGYKTIYDALNSVFNLDEVNAGNITATSLVGGTLYVYSQNQGGINRGAYISGGGNNRFISFTDRYNGLTGTDAVLIGVGSGPSNQTFGSYNTVIGSKILATYSNTGRSNVMVGYDIANGQDGQANNNVDSAVILGVSCAPKLQADSGSTILGSGVAPKLVSSRFSVIIGARALANATDSQVNTIVGSLAAQELTTGNGNVLMGNFAGKGLTTGFQNVLLGSNTQGTANVSYGVAVGYGATVNGNNGIAIGAGAVANQGGLSVASAANPVTVYPGNNGSGGRVLNYLATTINGVAFTIPLRVGGVNNPRQSLTRNLVQSVWGYDYAPSGRYENSVQDFTLLDINPFVIGQYEYSYREVYDTEGTYIKCMWCRKILGVP